MSVIFEATIQVLLAVGAGGLTTTRVAERAGVSIGSMYQYYPNKHALLFALIERHLGEVASVVESTCDARFGESAPQAVTAFVTAYVSSKSVNADASRALYSVSSGPEFSDLARRTLNRIIAAVTRLLDATPERGDLDNEDVAFTLVAIVTGATRVFIEQGENDADLRTFGHNIANLARSYLRGVTANTKAL